MTKTQMTRKDYLLDQKQKGRHIFGVFPAQYPKELLWAMNVVPAEIWDPPVEITAANAHLQPYICSVVRFGLELVLEGKCDFLDGFLFPHTCDSIQNMASVIHDYIGANKPCYFFYHPKNPHGKAAREYYVLELKNLMRSLEKQLGPLNPDALKQRIQQGHKISSLFGEFYDLRAKGELDVGNGEFYEQIRRGEYLFPDDLIPELEGFLARNKGKGEKRLMPVILSGVLPNPPEILTLFDELGVRVSHDDLLIGSRRLLVPPSNLKDPFKQLAESYFSMPPCSTKGAPIVKRREYLLSLIKATGAKGVIFNVVKFCEPEWFDVPNLTDELKKRGTPTLVLDTELNQGLSGQMKTRVEAFVEMIS
ncbi:MAG: 2-hydroxyacyl-CoA dehydratase [Deltaproteobacteria bacterium]|nr:2-hydroxyacyl-CoA dehydratase [Deltaproteobacteria bacterium]MBW1737360.1 2-hydroxyacyl-CoA dehydratase [Deltaproteobacteria bacterium]MBW1908587.1 2-hydroxyacyl-CoA dehydratase [Deltaproteobacteria bacterium]MBW2033110.1 2-hydroxyacyl-CoA dehydratase [Deltaproteobacteria bacterium]MBW2113933.1 2-hydroxyacyl-CoA dehydratase [Deltaproteobacteria bacterium]